MNKKVISVDMFLCEIRKGWHQNNDETALSIPVSNCDGAEDNNKIDFAKDIYLLIALPPEEFVKEAYLLLLGRQADEQGANYFTSKIKDGLLTKEEVFTSLVFSKEARKKKIRNPRGWISIYIAALIGKIPLFGRVYKYHKKSAIYQSDRAEREFNRIRVQLTKSQDQFSDSQGKLAQSEGQLAKYQGQLAQSQGQLAQSQGQLAQSQGQLAQSQEQLAQSQEQLAQSQEQLTEVQERLAEIQEQLVESQEQLVESQEQLAENQRNKEQKRSLLNEYEYQKFENKYREAEVAQLEFQSLVNKLFSGDFLKRNHVDLGCGEGEIVVASTSLGFEAIGIDSNECATSSACNKGINVVNSLALDYLNQSINESIDLITCYHLIEHIDITEQRGFLNAIYLSLKPGGFLVLEYPNVQNILVGTHDFYLDPTHKRPLPAALLSFVLEEIGFKTVDVQFLHGADLQLSKNQIESLPPSLLHFFTQGRDCQIVAQK